MELRLIKNPWFSKNPDGYYWRRVPENVEPTEAQLRARLKFAEAAYDSYGQKGFDDEGMPIVASNVARAMRGEIMTEGDADALRKRIDELLAPIES